MIKYFVVHVESPVKLFGLVLYQKNFSLPRSASRHAHSYMPVVKKQVHSERRLERRERKILKEERGKY